MPVRRPLFPAMIALSLASSTSLSAAPNPTPVESSRFESGLVDPPPGVGVAAVACRLLPAGKLQDCRVYDVKPIGADIRAAAVAKVEGQPRASSSRKETTVTLAVPVELPTTAAAPSASGGADTRYWLKQPSAAQSASVYPSGAQEKGLGGVVTMSCKAKPSGELYACLVLAESPEGKGFGAAALKLTPFFQLSATKADDTITFPLRFGVPTGPFVTKTVTILNAPAGWP